MIFYYLGGIAFLPWGVLCDLRTTWFVINLHLTAVNRTQSTKQQVKGSRSLFLLGPGYCPKKDPHIPFTCVAPSSSSKLFLVGECLTPYGFAFPRIPRGEPCFLRNFVSPFFIKNQVGFNPPSSISPEDWVFLLGFGLAHSPPPPKKKPCVINKRYEGRCP